MTGHQEVLAALTPEQQAAAVMAGHQEWVDRRQDARQAALEAEVARNPCCQDHNRDGVLRARLLGYDWHPELCPQHRAWEQGVRGLIHNIGGGHGEIDEAA